jgi:hypothetical protein
MANEGDAEECETRENESWAQGAIRVLKELAGPKDQTPGSGGSSSVRLRNLTGSEVLLIYRGSDGSEVVRRIPKDPVQVRVRYNRIFDRTPIEWSRDPEGSDLTIGVVESRPKEGVLPTCESVENLPPAEGGVRLIVHPAVVFALARRAVFRRDLVTLGRVRKDPNTRLVTGYENLCRVSFDKPELDEVPALGQEEDAY